MLCESIFRLALLDALLLHPARKGGQPAGRLDWRASHVLVFQFGYVVVVDGERINGSVPILRRYIYEDSLIGADDTDAVAVTNRDNGTIGQDIGENCSAPPAL